MYSMSHAYMVVRCMREFPSGPFLVACLGLGESSRVQKAAAQVQTGLLGVESALLAVQPHRGDFTEVVFSSGNHIREPSFIRLFFGFGFALRTNEMTSTIFMGFSWCFSSVFVPIHCPLD